MPHLVLFFSLILCVVAAGCSAGSTDDPPATATPAATTAAATVPPPTTPASVADPPAPVSIATMASSPTPSETPAALPTDTPTPAPTPTATVDPSLLLPDLQALPPYDMFVQVWPEGNHVIRFSNSILNAGPGVLKVLGESDRSTATTRVTQHVYNVDGTYDEHPAGVFEFHVTHDHWHVENFALYEVWSLTADGELDEVVAVTDKVSYCLMDETRSDRPDAHPEPTYTVCDQIIQGISPGWIDTYEYNTPGQIVDITGLPDGTYALRSTVDPDDQMREMDNGNNAGTTYFDLAGEELLMLDGPPTGVETD
ncbi:MAG: hypothetical protein KDH90_12800 [Anaerolineae bacterium]|nr:hypothetical protein [Anaerolineae bacterium]